MDYAAGLVKMLRSGSEDLWRNIEAMPAEKLDWKPEETSRSAHELLEELVSATYYSAEVLNTKSSADDAWESHSGKTGDELKILFAEKLDSFCAAITNFPEKDYTEEVTLPWGTMTYFDVMSYGYWNLMYHLGQIAYIQTLYGDKDMH